MSQTTVPQVEKPVAKPGAKPVATWRKVVAFILDLVFSFAVLGYVIGWATGGLTEEGFDLHGGPALLLFGLVILYFVLFARFLGGTIFQRLLRVR
jgi:hypothetical protein